MQKSLIWRAIKWQACTRFDGLTKIIGAQEKQVAALKKLMTNLL